MKKKIFSLCATIALTSTAFDPFIATMANASEETKYDAWTAKCATVEAVFARGSGQLPGDKESTNFGDELKKGVEAIDKNWTLNYYELGTAKGHGTTYPAVSIDVTSNMAPWLADKVLKSATLTETAKGNYLSSYSFSTLYRYIHNKYKTEIDTENRNLLTIGGAAISGGGAYEFGKSVNEGSDELARYIKERISKCPDANFIVGGYSQGAQVVGEAYNEKLTPDERKHIVFNALYGDPKLLLPEGAHFMPGIAPGGGRIPKFPDACAGKNYSTYRRYVPDCLTWLGSLNKLGEIDFKNPYYNRQFAASTGLWCNDDDYVCGSSFNPLNTTGHGLYAKGEPSPITQGVREGLIRLNLAEDQKLRLDGVYKHFKSGKTGLDVVFVIDSTGSMSSEIDGAKEFAKDFAEKIKKLNGRVALVEYRDSDDAFSARVLSGFNSDVTDFQEKLAGITVDGGGDDPEALLHALKTAFDGLSWRPGATKAAVVLTDAGYHNPDIVDGATNQSIAKRSLEIDPVNVYPVVPTYETSEYQELANLTSGQVIANDGDTASALQKALVKIETRPVVELPLSAYYVSANQSVHFDASSSYSVDSKIVRWDWDFNGDGIFDQENGSAITDYAYTTVGDYSVQVRATDENGGIASQSVPVHVDTVKPPELPAAANMVSVEGKGNTATLSWNADTEPTGGWVISINGVEIGGYEAKARQGIITDIARDKDIEFGVTPMSEEGILGETKFVTLKAENTSQPTATVTPEPKQSAISSPVPVVPSSPQTSRSSEESVSVPTETVSSRTEKVPVPVQETTVYAEPQQQSTTKTSFSAQPSSSSLATREQLPETGANHIGLYALGGFALAIFGGALLITGRRTKKR